MARILQIHPNRAVRETKDQGNFAVGSGLDLAPCQAGDLARAPKKTTQKQWLDQGGNQVARVSAQVA